MSIWKRLKNLWWLSKQVMPPADYGELDKTKSKSLWDKIPTHNRMATIIEPSTLDDIPVEQNI